MSELPRLSGISPNPLTRAVLASGQEDRPSNDARRNAAIALGIAGGLATTATAGSAAGTATGTAAASKWFGVASLLKIAGATVASGALVVGVVQHEQRVPAAAPRSSVQVDAADGDPTPVAHTRTAVPVMASPPPTPAESVAPIELPPAVTRPAARLAGSVAAPAPVAPPAHAFKDTTLREEVQRLDQTRATLAAGRVAAALGELDAYERAFPRGALRDEAELLRIETSMQSGDLGAAKARAERLLGRDEYGPFARRLRALLASLRSAEGAP